MKILVDENIPSITVTELRSLGHDVLDVRGTPQQGMEDADLWRLAQLEERLLITTDKGFAEHREEVARGPKLPLMIEYYGPKFNPQTGTGDMEVWIPVKN